MRHLAVVVLAALASPLAAQPSVPLTLAEAQRIALARSPQLEAQAAMADASREMAAAAGQLPDPQVFAGVENLALSGPDRATMRDGMTMTRIGVMQEFPREEKRRLRTARALREADRIAVAAQADALAIRRDAATAWLAALFAQRSGRAVAAQIAEAELQATVAAAAYRAGRGSQGDVLAAQGALVDLRNRSLEAELAQTRARIALARYLGDDAERPLAEPPSLDALPHADERLLDVDAQPDVRRVDAQVAVLDAESQLARANRTPDWSVEVSYGFRYNNPDMLSVMFRMDLPWSPGTRQDREVAARLRERDASVAMRDDARRMRASDVRQMIAEWRALHAQARRLRDELVPLARARTEAALASYRGGMGALAMVLEARRGELDAELALIAMEANAARTWAALATLVAGDTP